MTYRTLTYSWRNKGFDKDPKTPKEYKENIQLGVDITLYCPTSNRVE